MANAVISTIGESLEKRKQPHPESEVTLILIPRFFWLFLLAVFLRQQQDVKRSENRAEMIAMTALWYVLGSFIAGLLSDIPHARILRRFLMYFGEATADFMRQWEVKQAPHHRHAPHPQALSCRCLHSFALAQHPL